MGVSAGLALISSRADGYTNTRARKFRTMQEIVFPK
jgi:hypothetical protein